jgi:hypothetical protein
MFKNLLKDKDTSKRKSEGQWAELIPNEKVHSQ